MAQRRKETTARKGTSAARGKELKLSKSGRLTAAKSTIANQSQTKHSNEATPPLAPAKNVTRKRARPLKPLADYELSNTAARWFSRSPKRQ
jgi:hypothetical protein